MNVLSTVYISLNLLVPTLIQIVTKYSPSLFSQTQTINQVLHHFVHCKITTHTASLHKIYWSYEIDIWTMIKMKVMFGECLSLFQQSLCP